jgi:hypothetical protein
MRKPPKSGNWNEDASGLDDLAGRSRLLDIRGG